MALDLESFSPEARARFLVVGERYTTGAALAQADKTLAGCANHAAALVDFGFGPDDEQVMRDARDEALLRRAEYAQADGSRKTVSASFADSRSTGRHERTAGRTLLKRGANELIKLGNHEPARAAKSVLRVTRATTKDDDLPVHLETLLAALQEPAMAGVLVRRGGPQTVARIQTVLGVLDAAMRGHSASSPVMLASERRDILDGLLVTLARDAYASARLLARARKQPSIAAEFALTHLRRSRKHAAPAEPAPDAPTAPDAPAAPGAPAEIPAATDSLTR